MAPYGSAKHRLVMADLMGKVQEVGVATSYLGGDIRFAWWGAIISRDGTIPMIENVVKVLEARDAERRALMDAATTDLLKRLSQASPLYAATLAAQGKGFEALPPNLQDQLRGIARDWKANGFGSETEARDFLKNARVGTIDLHPSLTIGAKGSDGKVQWSTIEY